MVETRFYLRYKKTHMKIAVLVPCYNEEAAIGSVVQGFRKSLPEAQIYVYDNNSKDQTSARARAAGAIVRKETLQGKGHVVRRMFADIEADVYILVDGDDTYDASAAPLLVRKLTEESLDMVNAARIAQAKEAYRTGHVFGNLMITGLVNRLFGKSVTDVLSGYRVFSRRFVKSFPALAQGFEIETEFTVHALQMRMPIVEVETPYKERPPGSFSKLNTYRDGIRIVFTILDLLRELKPLTFFGSISLCFAALSVAVAIPIFLDYFATGLVPRMPSAILATGFGVLATLSLMTGVMLNSLARARLEAKRMMYLSHKGPGNFKAAEVEANGKEAQRVSLGI